MPDGSKLEWTLNKTPQDAGSKGGDTLAQPSPAASMTALRSALSDLDKASRIAGVGPEDPMGAWMICVKALLECSAEITLAREARITETVAALTAANEAERLALRSAADRCRAETQKLDKYSSALEVRAENLVTQTITSMSNKVAEEIKKRSVIVERQYNRRRLWERAFGIAAVMLVIFGAGLAAMRYEDGTAVALLNGCETHPFADPSGTMYCMLKPPPAQK